jgi:hypothetical protein
MPWFGSQTSYRFNRPISLVGFFNGALQFLQKQTKNFNN